MPAAFLNDAMERCRARSIVLLLDCCYSGAFLRATRGDEDVHLGERFEGRGRAVLTASNAIEYAWDGDDLTGEGQPSPFTGAVVAGLETGDADRDGDGLISVEDLYHHVFDAVRAAGHGQTPMLWAFGIERDVYVARNPRPSRVEPAPLPPLLAEAIENPLPGVRAGVVEELATLRTGTDAGLALAAREALRKLRDDDSRRVSEAAERALQLHLADGETVAPAPPAAAVTAGRSPRPRRLEAGGSPVRVAFSPDGRWLAAAGGAPATVSLWEDWSRTRDARHLISREAGIVSIAFSPDSRWLAQAIPYRYRTVVTVVATGHDRSAELSISGWQTWSVAFSPDGQWLAVGFGMTDSSSRRQGCLGVFGAGGTRPVHQITGLSPEVAAIAFTPDSHRMAAAVGDRVVTYNPPAYISGPEFRHGEQVHSLAYSPSGLLLVTGARDATAKVWNANGGALLGALRHDDDVNGVAFSPDGTWLATGSRDRTACLWDPQHGSQRRVLPHEDEVTSVAFSPDGRWLATGSGESVYLWPLE